MEAVKRFTVDFSYNCDGGEQEFGTAKGAILAVFPGAEVKGIRSHGYPIRVTIKDGSGEVIWTDDQRALFRKYSERRTKSIADIKAILEKRKEGGDGWGGRSNRSGNGGGLRVGDEASYRRRLSSTSR
eukprot:TRINITY_DN573_c0_g3_i2.p2 TRINITY_DN573_c0_g3~~TRINITY_DN573_c0_g3_i2.p2  ORF type:complete len:128 (-),score=11.05 TRINITY_DN573_c0_g3_i2:1830-2213(-)